MLKTADYDLSRNVILVEPGCFSAVVAIRALFDSTGLFPAHRQLSLPRSCGNRVPESRGGGRLRPPRSKSPRQTPSSECFISIGYEVGADVMQFEHADRESGAVTGKFALRLFLPAEFAYKVLIEFEECTMNFKRGFTGLMAACAISISAGAASAADMSRPVYKAAPMVAPGFN